MCTNDDSKRTVEAVDVSRLSDPEVQTRLRLLMISHKWDEDALAKRAGVTFDDVKALIQDPMSVTFGVVQRVCESLNISMNQLLGEFDLVTVRG